MMKMNGSRSLSCGKRRSRRPDPGQGGIFVMSIDRAKLIEQLLEVVNNQDLAHERQN